MEHPSTRFAHAAAESSPEGEHEQVPMQPPGQRDPLAVELEAALRANRQQTADFYRQLERDRPMGQPHRTDELGID
jgi:hypothetical protein